MIEPNKECNVPDEEVYALNIGKLYRWFNF